MTTSVTVFLAPAPINTTQFIPGGNQPASGAKLFSYAAGTSTKQATYTTSSGSVANSNPIILDSGGNVSASHEVWLQGGQSYDFTLAPSTDTDPPVSPYWTAASLTGINDPSSVLNEWVVSGSTATFVNASTFTITGDVSGILTPQRRLKTVNTAGTLFSTVSSSVFSASTTTIGIQSDSTGIDNGLSAVSYGLIETRNDALPFLVTPQRFGAKGDGVTDDSAAIQAAINSPASAVYLTGGTYKHVSTIALKKNLKFYGDGLNASILNYTGSSVAMQAIGASDNWKTVVRDIKVNTSTGTHGVRLKDLADFVIDSCFVMGFSTAGLHLTGTASNGICLAVRILNNTIQGNGKGILTDTNSANQIEVAGNRIVQNNNAGISIEATPSAWVIQGNDLEGNLLVSGTSDLYFTGNGIDVRGNYFECVGADHPAIICSDVGPGGGINIQGNFIQSDVVGATNGIKLGISAFVQGVVVSGNTFSNWTTAINAAAVQGGILGPNKLVNVTSHVGSVGGSTSGLKIFNSSQIFTVPFSSSMTADTTTGENFDISANSTSVGFTINAPTNPWISAIQTYTIRNTSVGALSTVTWNNVFKLSPWTQPGISSSRSITFKYNGTNWVQQSQTGVDVPN